MEQLNSHEHLEESESSGNFFQHFKHDENGWSWTIHMWLSNSSGEVRYMRQDEHCTMCVFNTCSRKYFLSTNSLQWIQAKKQIAFKQSSERFSPVDLESTFVFIFFGACASTVTGGLSCVPEVSSKIFFRCFRSNDLIMEDALSLVSCESLEVARVKWWGRSFPLTSVKNTEYETSRTLDSEPSSAAVAFSDACTRFWSSLEFGSRFSANLFSLTVLLPWMWSTDAVTILIVNHFLI